MHGEGDHRGSERVESLAWLQYEHMWAVEKAGLGSGTGQREHRRSASFSPGR